MNNAPTSFERGGVIIIMKFMRWWVPRFSRNSAVIRSLVVQSPFSAGNTFVWLRLCGLFLCHGACTIVPNVEGSISPLLPFRQWTPPDLNEKTSWGLLQKRLWPLSTSGGNARVCAYFGLGAQRWSPCPVSFPRLWASSSVAPLPPARVTSRCEANVRGILKDYHIYSQASQTGRAVLQLKSLYLS